MGLKMMLALLAILAIFAVFVSVANYGSCSITFQRSQNFPYSGAPRFDCSQAQGASEAAVAQAGNMTNATPSVVVS